MFEETFNNAGHYASRYVWAKIGASFFSAEIVLAAPSDGGKYVNRHDADDDAERLPWPHSAHSTREGILDFGSPSAAGKR